MENRHGECTEQQTNSARRGKPDPLFSLKQSAALNGRNRAGEAGNRLQIEYDVSCGLKSLLRIFFETVADDSIDRRRDIRIRPTELRWIVMQNRAHRVRGRITAKCLL